MNELTEDAQPAVTLPRLPRPLILTGRDIDQRRVTVRLDGRERYGHVRVTYDYGDRVAHRITLRPLTPGAPVEDSRWWWTDHSMRWGWLPYAARDAKTAPPHHADTDPATTSTHYPAPERPEMWIVVGGEWTRCRVLWRENRGGKAIYHVERPITDNGVPGWRHAAFFWDPRYMQGAPYRPGTGG